MATKKVTYSLDEDTVHQIDRVAEQLGRSKSQVVREAVAEYAARSDRLTEAERRRLLSALDEAVRSVSDRPAEEVDAELEALRRARRGGGRAGERQVDGR